MATHKVVKLEDGSYLVGMRLSEDELRALQRVVGGTDWNWPACNENHKLNINMEDSKLLKYMLASGEDALYYAINNATGFGWSDRG